MFSGRLPKFMLVPTLLGMLCLPSCETPSSDFCPLYPPAGPLVAAELEHAAYQDYPHTWEWLGRINKLRQELELCR